VRASSFAAVAVLMAAAAGPACSSVRSTRAEPPPAQEMRELWVEPADLATRDLYEGPGGAAQRPKPGAVFRFISKDTKWYSWGWKVKDAAGVEWSAKYGPEAQPEVVVSRILWAAGYHQPPTYYVEHWSLSGSTEDGPKTPCRFRPEEPGRKTLGEWRWPRNPFVGTRPYGGLIAFMRIVNNFDLLDRNNVIYEYERPEDGVRRKYVVKDLGAALGRMGPLGFERQGTKNDLEGFEKQDYIKGVDGDRVVFDDAGPLHRELYRVVTVADVRWISERLSRLSPQQWKDAFRAGGYPEDQADRFIRKIQEKVSYGLSLQPQG